MGVGQFNDDGQLIDIIEKPKQPPSNYAVIGLYLYDDSVFDIVDKIKPSARNELEITDINNYYIKNNALTYGYIEKEWLDMGSFDSLQKASEIICKNSLIT